MCDVLAAMPDATEHRKVLFGNNSDRPVRECRTLYFSAGSQRQAAGQIQWSYVSVPEIGNVLATLGCRPYWCWGYETGVNEAGVAGGNGSTAGTAGTGVRRPAEAPKDEFSESSLWWRFNRLLEAAAKEPVTRSAELRSLYDPAERRNRAHVEQFVSTLLETRRESFSQWIPEQIARVMEAIEELEKLWNLVQS